MILRSVLAVLPEVFFCAAVGAHENFEIERIADGVYAARPSDGSMAGANAAFIVNEDHVVVVDTHMTPASSRALLGRIREISDLPVRYVINTHWHPDHTQGNQTFTNGYPVSALTISHRSTREDLATLRLRRLQRDRDRLPGEIARLERQLQTLTRLEEKETVRGELAFQTAFLEELRQTELVLPEMTFKQSFALVDGRRRIHLLYFGRGHTRGDIVVYLPESKIAIVGNLVTGGPPFARDGYPSESTETLAALERIDVGAVIPGHGRVQRSNRIFSDRRRFLDEALRVIRRESAKGARPQEIADAIDPDSYRNTSTPSQWIGPGEGGCGCWWIGA